MSSIEEMSAVQQFNSDAMEAARLRQRIAELERTLRSVRNEILDSKVPGSPARMGRLHQANLLAMIDKVLERKL